MLFWVLATLNCVSGCLGCYAGLPVLATLNCVFRLPKRLFEVRPNGLADAGQFGARAQHAAAVIVWAVEIAACAGEQAVAGGGLGVV